MFGGRGLSLTPAGVLLLALSLVMTVFGAVMIFSASSIIGLTQEMSHYSATYYVGRQLVAAAIGMGLALAAWHIDYHDMMGRLLMPIWGINIAMLLMVIATAAGRGAYGATRWISVGPLTIQPSEFAKSAIIVAVAELIRRYVDEGGYSFGEIGIQAVWLVGVPLGLVLAQPDKGTVMVIGITLLLMLYLAGAPTKLVLGALGVGFGFMMMLALKDDYSRQRVLTMFNPWLDPYGDGYQLVQGFYAFASGGLFGVGIGNSRQKYAYLPMAHNDFIYAVVGEELGLVGTLAVLLLFLALVWLGFRIAREAPDLPGQLIAAGSMSLLAIQMLVNVCGILGMAPLTGKPVPFFSYGGTSIMATLLLVGLTLSVSRVSADAGSRRGFAVVEGASLHDGIRVFEGGASVGTGALRSSQAPRGRVSFNTSGTRRIDLGPGARDRLRR